MNIVDIEAEYRASSTCLSWC